MKHYRPSYHLAERSHWLNDPNGPVWYEGWYHLFFQHNPNANTWGDIHWAHARSRDLVHWELLPLALSPSHKLGELHCFSGTCFIDPSGRPTILYTSVGDGPRNALNGPQQWRAFGDEQLINWTKDESNPFLTLDAHGELRVNDWRDPFVWQAGDGWHMFLGGSIEKKGSVLHYQSADSQTWRFSSLAYQSEEAAVWECPNLAQLKADSQLLVYSPDNPKDNRVRWMMGRFDGQRFVPSTAPGILDGGGKANYYAALTMAAPDGRALVFGWCGEGDRSWYPELDHQPLEYNGALSLVRECRLLPETGSLELRPAEENLALRKFTKEISSELEPGRIIEAGYQYELEVIGLPRVESWSLELFLDPRTGLAACLDYHARKRCLIFDRSYSAPYMHGEPPGLQLPLPPGGPLNLRIYVDGSLVEIYVEGAASALSARVYSGTAEASTLRLMGRARAKKAFLHECGL